MTADQLAEKILELPAIADLLTTVNQYKAARRELVPLLEADRTRIVRDIQSR